MRSAARDAGEGARGAATPVNDASEYVATLKSRDSAVIMPQVEGQVIKIFVHSGDAVAAGAPLMEIDPLKQQATVKSQESARAAQQANLILPSSSMSAARDSIRRALSANRISTRRIPRWTRLRPRWTRWTLKCASRKCNCIITG